MYLSYASLTRRFASRSFVFALRARIFSIYGTAPNDVQEGPSNPFMQMMMKKMRSEMAGLRWIAQFLTYNSISR